jgi:hypothetical protein
MGGPNEHFEVVATTCTTLCNIKQDRQRIYVEHNSEARLRNYGYSGKAISVTYSECVSVALVIQHAKYMRCVMLSSVACPALPHFSALSQKRYDFSGK